MDSLEERDIEFIANQTNVTDLIEIKKAYFLHDKDITATIIHLLGQPSVPRSKNKKPRTIYDDIRDIFDEKEQLYRDHMSRQQQQHEYKEIASE